MGELVTGAVQGVLGMLASAAYEEIMLTWDVKDDLEKLKQKLEINRAKILDAEQKQRKELEIRTWLKKLRQFCHDAEDVLDEFEAEALKRQATLEHRSFRIKVRYYVSCLAKLKFRYKMGHKIKDLTKTLDDLLEEKNLFPLSSTPEDRSIVNRRETHSFVSVSGVFGRKDDKKRIIELLMSPSENTKISVVPIVGIGGVGKTTLAKMVFIDERVDQLFEIKVWVSMQVEFDLRVILTDIVQSLSPPDTRCDHWKMEQLQSHLRGMLENKRCLFILDDVWNVSRQEWTELRDLLEGVSKGSKIIVTSRNKSVAAVMRTVPEYDLKPLSDEDSISLFMKCAFEQGEEKSHPALVEIGKEIVKKCAGNPLAVKTLGSLLYSKNDERNWVHVRDSEIWKMETDILPSLRISYDLMPLHLKQCFAYCSIFPKNYEFNNLELIQLWIANGLIQPSSGSNQELEEIGQQYWEELWSRSFFEDVVEDYLFLTFRMHDLIHQLCLSVAENESSVVNVGTGDVYERIRHLSLADPNLLSDELPKNLSKLRGLHTVMFPVKKEGPTGETFLSNCISTFKHLRVLHLHDSTFEGLPSSVGKLRHLRFLHLCGNPKIKRLPNSVCELQNLQSLGLAKCEALEELPVDMKRMINLRFLDITTKQVVLPENGIGSLTSLRALFIGDCDNLEALCEDICSLTSLKKFFVGSCPRLKDLPRGIRDIEKLENLWIGNCENLKLSDEEGNQTSNIRLKLRSLVLFRLPKLVSLPKWLEGSATTLRRLVIEDCPNFRYFPEWLQRCSSLQKLKIAGCPQVSRPQEGFPLLASLKLLTIEESGELSSACRRGGEDWPRITHVPEIHIDGERTK
ncbi:disease resistance protein RGA2-like [Punica granatum]|uniref:Disease resistance protein RGA2-like n=1 Tax=Punica granatum TaxID=22663 RepID=A0A218W562_PUNGR|nr:disease resistance protein RGA2-like [Punica granatum]OWM67242.1 hypothetical protein CDL15_Pgr000694 [Punica granatum]